MKIRIANNSIRFRLKQPEVEYFSQHRSISEVLEMGFLPREQLRFTLKCAAHNEVSIVYSGDTITVQIPNLQAQEWIKTDLVSIEEEINTSGGRTVKLLVEKDFACLDKRGEENEGAYPNPKAAC